MRVAAILGVGLLVAACGGSSASVASNDGGTNPEGGGTSPEGGDAGACATSVTPSGGVALTDRGPVQGTMENGAWAYLGIPYSAPPVGALRWADTQAHACWATTLAASAFGAKCLQVDGSNPSSVLGQEDCLTANVWTPPSATSSMKLPVLVFIHGGGNVQGSSADTGKGSTPIYDGAALAAKQNAVVVTFNYRLGPLGFLAHTAFGANPGNYGLRDQLFLLGWVQRNAAAFGGDAKHVLVFGQSAGAEDVCDLVASPLSKGLFTAAIAESGGCAAKTTTVAQSFAQTWAQKAGCGSASDVASCLRALSANAVALVQPEPASVAGARQGDYEPSIDGAVIPSAPDQILRAGTQAHVPIVFGSNSDETSLELAQAYPQGITAQQYAAMVLTYASGSQALADQILAMYPAANYATPLEAYVQVTTDAKFTTTASYDACVTALGQSDAPVWRYFYTHHLDDGTAIEKALGAWHGQELAFVFTDLGAGGYKPSAGELTLDDTIDADWASMAASGAPTGSPSWPKYDPASDPYVQLDDTVTTGTGLRTAQVQFWNKIIGRSCP
jgi:para-nitrobenzyl esterase